MKEAGGCRLGDVGVVSPTVALLVVERLVMVVSERRFLRPLLTALFAGGRAAVPLPDQVSRTPQTRL
jgi:hypothetical protein